MSWKPLLAGILLLAVQATTTPSPPVPGIVVEVGSFPMDGIWYQDGVSHVHDKVRIRPAYYPNGTINVTVGTTGQNGTDITFYFSHDETGRTRASASAVSRSDVHADGHPSLVALTGIEGRILIQSDDWGPGKTLNALFEIHGLENKSPEFLIGCFSILEKK